MVDGRITRRRFLAAGAAVSAGFLGLRSASRASSAYASSVNSIGYGPLQAAPEGVMALPRGFTYRVLSRTGDEMDDGLLVPGLPDGMAAFAGPDGTTLVVRNHEMENRWVQDGPFGPDNERLDRLDPRFLWDAGVDAGPALGGTSTLVYDHATGEVRLQYLSLAGTVRNCAGGPTPWGSWVTCEETVQRAGDGYQHDHGYNFEVPASATIAPVEPVPLTAMGRFNHEAIAVDPRSGIVYQTEDRHEGLIYRFIPNVPGRLAEGGRLQALVVVDRPGLDTRNWDARMLRKVQGGGAGELVDTSIDASARIAVGQVMPVRWIDMEDIESPKDDLRFRGHAAGAARFARGEGMWQGDDAIYFACTNGGRTGHGQVWRYRPSPVEGTPDEQRRPGMLELFIEPNDVELVKNADNLTVAPWGDVIICEDSSAPCRLVGVTPEGRLYRIGENTFNSSELAGATFSPDASTLFVNIQKPGITLAITGPWSQRA